MAAIKIIKFDILKSVLNSAPHDASRGKAFFIISQKINMAAALK